MKILKFLSELITLKCIYKEVFMQLEVVRKTDKLCFPCEFKSYPEMAGYFGPFMRDCMQS